MPNQPFQQFAASILPWTTHDEAWPILPIFAAIFLILSRRASSIVTAAAAALSISFIRIDSSRGACRAVAIIGDVLTVGFQVIFVYTPISLKLRSIPPESPMHSHAASLSESCSCGP